MKHLLISAIIAIAAAIPASAQYYQIANQIPQLISPVLSGSTNYKGFVEASYTTGLGSNKADFLEFTTTQGFTYSDWFFMGVGAGVDVMFSHTNDGWGDNWGGVTDFDYNRSSRTTSAMIPLYSDFRFNIGGKKGPSFFIDVRLGCAFLVGKDYVRIGDGYITNQEYFYLKPTIGVRIPVSSTDVKKAFNIGVTYQLLTSNYWNYYRSNTTLNSLGANISYEW